MTLVFVVIIGSLGWCNSNRAFLWLKDVPCCLVLFVLRSHTDGYRGCLKVDKGGVRW